LPPPAASGTIGRMTDRTPRRGPAALRPPRLPGRLDGPGPVGGRLADGATYDALALAHDDLSGQAAAEVGLAGAVLEAVNLGGTDLPELRLTDVRLAGCDLANAGWRKARWERVEGAACRAVGLQTNEATLRDVRFRDCDLRLAQFRFARFRAVRFEGCQLREADFRGADLSGVAFARCDLRDADLSEATLTGTDLRASQVEGLRLGAQEARGLIVDPLQLLELVRCLGVTVLPGVAGEPPPAAP
jgi:uncharacterized protein YjbI with pentapeptide repeats